MEAKITWQSPMAFKAQLGDHAVVMDAVRLVGGRDEGATPKQLLLAAIGGCTGMDISSLMKKWKEPLESFEINIAAEKTTEHPTIFTALHIDYFLVGEGLDPEKAIEAAKLSQSRYCAVSAMVSKAVPISYDVHVNGKNCYTGKAEFP